jgi:hypothetical protein
MVDGTSAERALDELARGLTDKVMRLSTQALRLASAAERGELLALLHRVYDLPGAAA